MNTTCIYGFDAHLYADSINAIMFCCVNFINSIVCLYHNNSLIYMWTVHTLLYYGCGHITACTAVAAWDYFYKLLYIISTHIASYLHAGV